MLQVFSDLQFHRLIIVELFEVKFELNDAERYSTCFISVVVARVEESEVKCPTHSLQNFPTCPKCPTPKPTPTTSHNVNQIWLSTIL